MNEQLYKQILQYKETGLLPTKFNSHKSNFLSVCSKYNVNKKKNLTRDGKIVLKKNDKKWLWKEMHQHSGRSKCWKRISDR